MGFLWNPVLVKEFFMVFLKIQHTFQENPGENFLF